MRIIAIAILLASQSVMAATCWMDEETEQIRWFRPSSVTIGSKTYTPAPDDLLAQVYAVREYEDCDLKYRVWSWKPAAIRAMTQAERDAVDAKEAAALAAANDAEDAADAKEKAIAAAADYAAAKAKKEEAAKLEAVAAVAEKEPPPDEKLAMLWKWKLAELEAEKK